MSSTKEKFRTKNNVFDAFTNRNIFSLEGAGYFEQLDGTIALGKEANVFRAIKKDNDYVAIKIYRLETCDFNKMYDYIKCDNRYASLKRRKREIIFTWAQREFRNILKFRDIGIRFPTPIKILHNILLLEFIGDNGEPSRQLKNQVPEDIDSFFKIVVDYMKKIAKAELVHGDLSEYNILNYNDEPVFIDASQSTTKKDPNYEEFWDRDIRNISRFFSKYGVETDSDSLKNEIFNN